MAAVRKLRDDGNLRAILGLVVICVVFLLLLWSWKRLGAGCEQFRQIHEPVFTKTVHPRFGEVAVLNDKDMISRAVLGGNIWEEELCKHMAAHYVDGTDMMDIGANMGFSTLGMNQFKPITGTVHAFEPQFRLCNVLSYNLRNVSSRIFNCAVGSEGGKLITYKVDDGNVGATKMTGGDSGVFVPVIRLDDHIDMFTNKISLIKIDVEGQEMSVLNGATGLIAKHKPVIEVEAWGGNKDAVQKLMASLGYMLVWNQRDDYIFKPLLLN